MTKNRPDERPFDAEAYEQDTRQQAAGMRRDGVDADEAGVVLHEERLVAGVELAEAGRVEVRKRVVVEEVTITVPVRREVVDVVRVYDDGSEEAVDVPASTWQPRIENLDGGSALGEHTHAEGEVYDVEAAEGTHTRDADRRDEDGVIVLHEERPVLSTRIYAVERLHLGISATKENVTVTEPVQREVVEVDEVDDVRDPRGEGGSARA